MKKSFSSLCICTLLCLAIAAHADQAASEKKKITTIDDLPRYSYDVPTTATDLVTSEEAFRPFAAMVRADIEKDLATYQIEDKSTLKDFHGILLVLDMLEGNYDAALEGIQRMRELEDKPANRLMSGLISESAIRTLREVGMEDISAYRETFSRHLSEALEELPWNVIQERAEQTKGRMEMMGENLLMGIVQTQIDPVVEETHQVSNRLASQIIGIRYVIEFQLPLKSEIIRVFEELIKANRVEKPDIWEERNVDLSDVKDLHPVVIGIWDTGVDTGVFPDRLFVNTGEKLDGEDNDRNGFIDDLHGIAYTLEAEKTPELLFPIENAEERLPGMKDMMKGYFDLQAAIDSPEAQALRQKMAEMDPAEVETFMEDLMQFVLYMHGTHVAGIAVDGNPAARILVVRLTADHRTIPLPPTAARALKAAAMFKEVVGYLKANGVRVVNMSWGGTLRETESALEANGIGKDAAERAELARKLFDIEKNALYDAIESAPEILFVNGAGNENDDVSFEDHYPTAFDLPNVLVVGAVDKAGDETSFTSFGERVDVYANGYEVESYLPGGEIIPASGTSMSSPNAANLAAKLLALNPSLTPAELVALITEGADASADGRLLLINPGRSVELLQDSKTD